MWQLILNYKKILILVSIIILTISSYFYVSALPKEEIVEDVALEVKEPVKEINNIHIDIKGAINKPGVYELKEGSLIIDAINISGGLTSDSDTSITNLAYKLTDGISFKIYTKKEVRKLLTTSLPASDCICPTQTNTSCITTNLTTTTTSTNSAASKLISINTATSIELQTLSGIGESTANKIIDYRTKNGLFKVIEDIKNVSGIGDAIFAKIKDYITI